LTLVHPENQNPLNCVVSYGEEHPQSEMDGESGWKKNRRVEFIYQ
jgi:outer membrane protein OmpA-like peptidoglycan-associated protein